METWKVLLDRYLQRADPAASPRASRTFTRSSWAKSRAGRSTRSCPNCPRCLSRTSCTTEVSARFQAGSRLPVRELQGAAQPAEGPPALRAKATGRWYVPDPNKAADMEMRRTSILLREFEDTASPRSAGSGCSVSRQSARASSRHIRNRTTRPSSRSLGRFRRPVQEAKLS